MSADDVVLFEMMGLHVALVTLNRPAARNAINAEVAARLESIVRETEADVSVRAVVITGAGNVFSAGADLKQVSQDDYRNLYRDEFGFAGFVDAPRRKPWIAAVEGFALAGGCELALACDMLVAARGAFFGLPEVTRGLIAAAGGLFRLPRALPEKIAIELILTGDRLSAERAAELGMVNHITAAEGAVAVALTIADKIAGNAPLAVAESLRIAKDAADLDEHALQQLSQAAQIRLSETEDFREGPTAFIEKRAPVWQGR